MNQVIVENFSYRETRVGLDLRTSDTSPNNCFFCLIALFQLCLLVIFELLVRSRETEEKFL